MHAIVWFFTTGIHDAAWVQAVAAMTLVVLTFVTLIVLSIYAWDTHTLARTSVEQINLAKKEHTFQSFKTLQAAYDSVFKTNDNVRKILQSICDGTFGTKPQQPTCPDNWPETTAAFIQRDSSMTGPMIALGVNLQAVDLAVEAFFDASNNDEKRQRETAVHQAVLDATTSCTTVIDAMKKLNKPTQSRR